MNENNLKVVERKMSRIRKDVEGKNGSQESLLQFEFQ